MRNVFIFLSLITLFTTCNKKAVEESNKYPIVIKTIDFSLNEAKADWINFKTDSVYIINSQVEYESHTLGNDIPNIDFKQYSLIVLTGIENKKVNEIEKEIIQTSESQYKLIVTIRVDEEQVQEDKWVSAVLISKIEKNINIELSSEYIQIKKIIPVFIGQGSLYGNGKEGIPKQNLIITEENVWKNLQMAVGPNITDYFIERDIDFSEYQLIAVFDNIRMNGGWTIDITEVIEQYDKIIVKVTNLNKGNATNVITQPFHIAKIPVSNKRITFSFS